MTPNAAPKGRGNQPGRHMIRGPDGRLHKAPPLPLCSVEDCMFPAYSREVGGRVWPGLCLPHALQAVTDAKKAT